MTQATKDMLAPCPFCAKSVAVVTTATEMWPEHEDEGNAESFAVMCDASMPGGPGGCGASSGFAPTADRAIELWNTRAAYTEAVRAQADHPDLTVAYMVGHAKGVEDGRAKAAPSGEVLHTMNYHPREDGDWDLYDPDIECADCIPVLIVRAVAPPPPGIAPPSQPTGEPG